MRDKTNGPYTSTMKTFNNCTFVSSQTAKTEVYVMSKCLKYVSGMAVKTGVASITEGNIIIHRIFKDLDLRDDSSKLSSWEVNPWFHGRRKT